MKRKILFIMNDFEVGGVGKVLIDILRNMDYTRYDVDLLLLYNKGGFLKDVPDSVHILSCSGTYRFILFMFVRFVRKILIKLHIPKKLNLISLEYNKYNAIISFAGGLSLLYHDFIMKRKKCLQISWIHTDMLSQYPDSFLSIRNEQSRNERSAYQQMDRIVCVSNDAKKKFQLLHNIPNEKLKVVYNLVDRLEILRKSKLLDVKKEKFTIGFVGRLTKRADRLIRIARQFVEDGYDIAFWFLGDGGVNLEMELLSRELQVEKYCEFWGYQDNPYPYMKEFDIYVNLSDLEGFSLTVCESFCLGCAVVATRTCGPVELLDNDRYGLLVDFDDVSIYRAIKGLVDDPERLHYYQSQALERSQMFDANRAMEEIYSVIEN